MELMFRDVCGMNLKEAINKIDEDLVCKGYSILGFVSTFIGHEKNGLEKYDFYCSTFKELRSLNILMTNENFYANCKVKELRVSILDEINKSIELIIIIE